MNLTTKQKEILTLIVNRNSDGTPIDLDELLTRLPYHTTKQSMQFSVRALVGKGYIEKCPTEIRRGRMRRLFQATPLGLHAYATLCPKPTPVNVDEVIDANKLAEMEASLGL